MRRLHLNKGRYHGEGLDVRAYLDGFHQAATTHGWKAETFASVDGFDLRGYSRPHPTATQNIYISTGIHGDEPAGPVALLRLIEENQWPQNANLFLCPCLNPTGLATKTRENAQGIDLNRDYRHPQTAEVRAHVRWLESLPQFDLTLILHEDWESEGYYVYNVNRSAEISPAARIIETIREFCPVQPSGRIDEMWDCVDGIIHPDVIPDERPQWAEALYLIVKKTKLSMTLEAPSDFPLLFRAEAHVRALRCALEANDTISRRGRREESAD